MQSISHNLTTVQHTIKVASQVAGRSSSAVTLVAVSKGKSEEDVRAAMCAGQIIFGENRVQEAKTKFIHLREAQQNFVLHLIGPLQTNKVSEAVKLFDVIETLDRKKLADTLCNTLKLTDRKLEFYIEINTGDEEQKAGILAEELPEFLSYCRTKCALNVTGLMCIPPQGQDPTPHFRKLKELADQHKLENLSMGMSNDYELAIREGATVVRVGTAIFGARDHS